MRVTDDQQTITPAPVARQMPATRPAPSAWLARLRPCSVQRPLAWQMLRHDRLRLLRSVAGVAFAVFLIFAEIGFLHGLYDNQVELIKQLNADIVITNALKRTISHRQPFARAHLVQARALPEVEASYPLYIGLARSGWKNPDTHNVYPIRLLAFRPEDPILLNSDVAAHTEALKRPGTVLIDAKSKPRYGKREAGVVTELGGQSVRVAGIFRLGTDFVNAGTVIMSAQNFRKFLPHHAGLGEVEIGVLRLSPAAHPAVVADTLRQILPNDVSIDTKRDYLARELRHWRRHTPIGVIFGLGAAMGIIIGVIICHQILYTEVVDHLPQFATLKAMGYPNRFLMWIVWQQALVLSWLGFGLGLGISHVFYRFLSHQTGLLMRHLSTWRAGLRAHGDHVYAGFRHRHSQSAVHRPGRGILMLTSQAAISEEGEATAPAIVRLQQLNHYYGAREFRKQVLFDVDLELRAGEMTIMTGPSGSGKTTLLSLIGALRRVQAGSAYVQGRELRGLSQKAREGVRRHIGFIFQSHNLFESLTAVQNVMMALGLHAYTRKEKQQLATHILVRLGLEHRLHAKPQAMSGGERQRVAVSRALVLRPKLILADEPTAALDKEAGRNVVQLLQQLAQTEQAAVIMVTHDNRILDVADRIVNLADGRIVSNVAVRESVETYEFLLKCPVLGELTPAARATVAEKMTAEHYAPDAVILRQGDVGDTFYVIRQGAVSVTSHTDGAERVLAIRRAGEFFGEAALLTDNPRNATVRAIDDVELLALGKDDFKAALEISAKCKDQFLQVLFQRQ